MRRCHTLLNAALLVALAQSFHITTSPAVRTVNVCRALAPLALAAGDDPYSVLGVPRTASAAQIKQAYRRLALRSHPDVNKAPDAQEVFAKIADAYAVLSDPAKRAKVDRTSTGSSYSSYSSYGAGASRKASDPAAAAAARAAAAERQRRWREENPTPDELGDSFGSLLGDIASAVGRVVGGGDWLSLLDELQLAEGAELQALLRSRDVALLTEELEDTRFVQKALNTRITRLTAEAQAAADDAAAFTRDAARRGIARSVEQELQRDLRRRRERLQDARRLLAQAQSREQRIAARIEEVRNGGGTGSGSTRSKPRAELPSVEDELRRLKEELGR